MVAPLGSKNFMHRPFTSILIECPTTRADSRSNYLFGNWLHVALLILSVGITTGCSSAISMREALRDSIEQAAAVSQLTVLSDVESDPS